MKESKRKAKAPKRQKPQGRIANKLIPFKDGYLVGAPAPMDEDRPLFFAWLDDGISGGREDGGAKIYEQLSQQIFEPDPERSRIITLHLYVEYWLDEILKISKGFPQKTFRRKIDFLLKSKSLDDELFKNLIVINDLRNIYAHELDLTKAHENVHKLLSTIVLNPRFHSSDQDKFRHVCIQTMFSLESIFANNGKFPALEFPRDKIRSQLEAEGRIHWQYCNLLSKKKIGTYIFRFEIECPLCNKGTITREKDETPGFKEWDMTKCTACGLSGDGQHIILERPKV